MLELSKVSVRLGGRDALKSVSLAFVPGELLALIGPNGSGKSTLLRTAAGLVPCTGGAVLLDGVPLDSIPPKAAARQIAYLPQSRRTPDLTALRLVLHGRFPYLEFPRRLRPADRAAAVRAMETAGAADLAGQFLPELSGGERQRVYLAAVLAQEGGTVLMDEPTTYLDVAHQYQTAELARKLALQGQAAALVLHDLPLAFRYADRIAVLRAGELVCAGTPEELYTRAVVPEVFGVRLLRFETERGPRYDCELME